ncbi:hypothetical protein E2C01_081679 [Portunus trituberculatus]|uniref:Uncharacterized protein n=1 Tax=Portunus trituberculatus TaxID=210409 RepID=A0A5B7IX64_PORTR|nr:hypothetical protein [Portunus trituberculatus]
MALTRLSVSLSLQVLRIEGKGKALQRSWKEEKKYSWNVEKIERETGRVYGGQKSNGQSLHRSNPNVSTK